MEYQKIVGYSFFLLGSLSIFLLAYFFPQVSLRDVFIAMLSLPFLGVITIGLLLAETPKSMSLRQLEEEIRKELKAGN
ncbi:hypothetical protein [Sulfuracidifex metallicus]|uniref:hypothetical protein n=1 Tax=Sulfuracidifex metallicus TaxID=47303 RepID=UPI0022763B76|nr:hypothetical protein [Sulfuracidifex metallicus]MCY0851008.1 hypothetical protein [Sulfuracidifex metallicus]